MTETRLPRIAGALYVLSVGALVIIPILIALALFSPSLALFELPKFTEIPRAQWGLLTWIGLFSGFLPAPFFWMAVNAMRRLFGVYRLGDPLAPNVGPLIKSIGTNLLYGALLGVAVVPIQSSLMSWANPAGERMVAVSLSSNSVGFFLVAGLLILIGWSMTEATRIAAENREFV